MFTAFTPAAQASATFTGIAGNIQWSVVMPGSGDGTLYIQSRTAANVAMPSYTSTGRPPWQGHSANVNMIVIEANVTDIGNWAFADFSKVTEVIVRRNPTRIGNDAFRDCVSLEQITADDGFTSPMTIGDRAFYNCVRLKEMVIPGVTAIGTEVFIGCRFDNIYAGLDGRVRSLGVNDIVVEMNSALTQPVRVIKSPVTLAPNSGAAYILPPGITVIDAEAFTHLSSVALSEFVISESVMTVGANAFAHSVNLRQATFLGHAPTSFGAGLFLNVHPEFCIEFYPYAQRWTTPTWQGYPTRVNNSRITLDKYFITLEVGVTTEIRATINPASAGQIVEWSVEPNSSTDPTNGNFATIGYTSDSRIGLVTGKSPGVAYVRAKADSGAEVECIVVVVERGVTNIALDRSQLTVQLGETATRTSLTAIVNPSPTVPGGGLIWSSSNTNVARVETDRPDSLTNWIEFRNPGTATITVRTPDSRASATFVLTLLAPPTFIPVTDVTLSTTTAARGARVDLNEISTVLPANATNKDDIEWLHIHSTTGAVITDSTILDSNGILTVPANYQGNIIVEAVVKKGRADMDPPWNFSSNMDFTRRFTINIVQFMPVANITDIPLMAYVGIPLQLKGTVNPAGASYKTIKWSVTEDNTDSSTPVIFDATNGILTAQWPGSVIMRATIENGLMGAPTGLGSQALAPYVMEFTVWVYPYTTNELNLRANPGGRVSNSGMHQLAGGEVITVTATPDVGYIFSGWSSTFGGTFANASNSTTQFTMPGVATTVTAQFTFTGTGGGGGDTVLPTPTHYFKNGSIYTKGSVAEFTHVTVRDFSLFSHVTLNGLLLTRNGHYTAVRTAGHTEIVLANGYLDTLDRGTYTLGVHFSDLVSVTARFTVTGAVVTPPMFGDVPASAWFSTGVNFVGSRGWMTPDANRNFRPNANVTQGEVMDALHRMAGLPSVLNQRGQPLYGRAAAQEWMMQSGILPISGQFSVNSAITRQDVTLLLFRLTHHARLEYRFIRNAYTFADEWQISGVARNAVSNAYRAGLINGRTPSTFVPLGNMTRAEFATLLHRYSDMVSIYA